MSAAHKSTNLIQLTGSCLPDTNLTSTWNICPTSTPVEPTSFVSMYGTCSWIRYRLFAGQLHLTDFQQTGLCAIQLLWIGWNFESCMLLLFSWELHRRAVAWCRWVICTLLHNCTQSHRCTDAHSCSLNTLCCTKLHSCSLSAHRGCRALLTSDRRTSVSGIELKSNLVEERCNRGLWWWTLLSNKLCNFKGFSTWSLWSEVWTQNFIQ